MTTFERSWADAPRSRSLPSHAERTPIMKHLTKSRAAIVSVAAASALVMGSGVAYAFWSTTGTGTAAASAGTAAAVNVTVSVSGGPLYPGGPSLSSTATFTNTNPFPVTISSVTPGTITVTNAAGCTSANAAVTFSTLTGPWTVPAKVGSTNGTFTTSSIANTITMGSASNTLCQGATFTAALTVAGTSS